MFLLLPGLATARMTIIRMTATVAYRMTTTSMAYWMTAALIASATTAGEAMAAPTMAIAPVGPWTHSQEDAVVEIAGPIKAAGGAGIGCIVVVTIGADGWNV
jgi:hypothetical protein